MTGQAGSAGFLHRAEFFGRFVENTILVTALAAMILLASSQILLRNVFESGFEWADEALRLMVLWVALFGAVAASRDNRHISIDLLSRLLPGRFTAIASLLAYAFTAAVGLTMAWYSGLFVAESYEFEDQLLGNLPAWWFQSVIPIAFGLIGYRYTIWTLRSMRDLIHGGPPA